MAALKLVQSRCSNRYQRTLVNATFIESDEIITEVHQGWMLGSSLFNIFLHGVFNFINRSRIYNFADNNAL